MTVGLRDTVSFGGANRSLFDVPWDVFAAVAGDVESALEDEKTKDGDGTVTVSRILLVGLVAAFAQ